MDGDSQISPGLTLAGRYTILNAISAGAMGAVFRAHDSEEGREVALKRLTDTRHAARFDIEARLLSALRHPRVVRVLDHFDEPSGRYIVMELIEGQDLGLLLKKRGNPGLPLSEALDYAREACEALQYVHEQQIIHRDVKPQNLIDSNHGVVLVDFGVAREMEEEEAGGTVGIGTPRFMAPEVFAGGTVSPRSDVFGIAATVWTLITGKPPVYAEPTKLIDVCPEVSPSLERTIRAGLEMIPERRVASIGAFAKALGAPLQPARGRSLALSVDQPDAPRSMMEAIVRTAAGVFEAAASSIALTDATTGELVYQSAWGAGAREIVGVRLPPGTGISGAVVASGEGQAVRDCRSDPRFAAQIAAGTGYVPRTMVVVPLMRAGSPIGALSVLDRRDGGFYSSSDLERALMFAELAVTALDVQPDYFTSLGQAEQLP